MLQLPMSMLRVYEKDIFIWGLVVTLLTFCSLWNSCCLQIPIILPTNNYSKHPPTVRPGGVLVFRDGHEPKKVVQFGQPLNQILNKMGSTQTKLVQQICFCLSPGCCLLQLGEKGRHHPRKDFPSTFPLAMACLGQEKGGRDCSGRSFI